MILGIVMILWYIHHMIFVLRERLRETEKERKRRKRMMFEDLIFNHILSKQVLKIFSLPTFSVFIRETPLILCTLVSLKPCFVYIVLNPKWTQTHSALVFSCAFIVVKRKPEMFFFSLTEIFICKYPLTGLLPKKKWVLGIIAGKNSRMQQTIQASGGFIKGGQYTLKKVGAGRPREERLHSRTES